MHLQLSWVEVEHMNQKTHFCLQYFSYLPLKLTQSTVTLVRILLPQAPALVSAVLTCLLSAALPRCLLVPHIHWHCLWSAGGRNGTLWPVVHRWQHGKKKQELFDFWVTPLSMHTGWQPCLLEVPQLNQGTGGNTLILISINSLSFAAVLKCELVSLNPL